MKFLVVFAAVAAVASAGVIAPIAAPAAYIPAATIRRAPAFDSAVIKSDRLGANFAYSTAENHAYAVDTPIVQNVATPIGVSYSAPAVVAAPAVHHVAAAPALAYAAHAAPVAYASNYGWAGYGINGYGLNGYGLNGVVAV